MEDIPNSDIKLQTRRIVREAHNVLKCSSSDGHVLVKTLTDMIQFLPNLKKLCNDTTPPLPENDMKEARREFMSSHYRQWLETLVSLFSIDCIEKLPRGKVSLLVDTFFLQGIPAEAFTVLLNSISANSPGYKLQKCVSLLETFLREHQMQQLLWDQCELGTLRGHSSRVGKVDPYTQQVWHELITVIATVPERVTNKLHREASETFFPDHYVPLLTGDILATLQKVHDSLQENKECSISFIGQLLGKLCVCGYGERIWTLLVPRVAALVAVDYVWSRVCENLVTRVPDTALEAVVTPLIQAAPWYVTISKLLGNSVITSQKLNYLLTNKLLLLRHFKEDRVTQNIIGYLASSPSRKHLYVKLLRTLLEVWGNASAVRHTAYDQHQYICRAILVCLAFLDDRTVTENKESLTKCLLSGMQPHLESSLPQVRRLGMIVAEKVSKKLDPTSDHPLEFEYDRSDPEVERLLDLLTPPGDPGQQDVSQDEMAALERRVAAAQLCPETSSVSMETPTGNADDGSDLDSDDDLEPYDLSNDTKVPKVKAPVYLRDCMEGVLSSDDPDKVEACLLVAEKLIRTHPSTVNEVATDFTKLLLHLEDTFSLPAFRVLRHSSMVALATTAPIQVATYLTKEFYGRNYNIRQRMDILEVLGAAAQELSSPTLKTMTTKDNTPKIQMVNTEAVEPESWRQVVQKRIDSKTKRLTRGRQQPELPEVANRFAPVAGHFFFPLLENFDRPEVTLDLMGEDHVVLSRLLYTLGMIVYSAAHAPVVRQMGSALMQFIWVVRFHPQPSVRQAALFAVSMVVLALPGFMLVADLNQETVEAKNWLEGVVQNDVNKECQKMALQALVLIENVFKQEFGGVRESTR